MPIFKGFEKNEGGDLLARVNYPNGKKYTLSQTVGGTSEIRQEPFPRTELLNEDAFKGKFRFGFDSLKDLPFNEEGHDLKPLILEQAKEIATNTPNLGLRSKPGNNSTL